MKTVLSTVLSDANVIDCVEPKVRPDSAVLIEDGGIRAILPSGEAGSAGDAQMIATGTDLRRLNQKPARRLGATTAGYDPQGLGLNCNKSGRVRQPRSA